MDNDLKLCEKIVGTLGRDGPQRVLLAGKAGIGKTRLAKKVAEYVTEKDLCYLTLCLHLNRKFDDEWSLYENIASQLSLYSDYEETEVDDRDEDEEEEKIAENLLKDLKEKISKDLKEKKELAEEKAKELAEKKMKELAEKKAEADRKAKELAGKKVKETGTKKQSGEGDNQTADGKGKPSEAEKTPGEGEKKDASTTAVPYLLLILDDEGKKTSENKIMKDLKLENFLKDHKHLKIIVTRIGGYEEAPKPGEDIKSHATDESLVKNSEEENESHGTDEPHDTKSENDNESHGEDKEEDANGEGENESHSADKPQAEIVEEITEPSATNKAHGLKNEGESKPPTIDESKAATKCYEKIEFCTTDESHALIDSFTEENAKDLFESVIKDSSSSLLKYLRETYKTLIDEVKKSMESPAAIVVLAKSLNCITHRTSNGGSLEEKMKFLKEKIETVLSAERLGPSDPNSSSENTIKPCRYNSILRLAYELLETYNPLKDAIFDCFWHSLDFFKHCGCVYYRDLITQWILEGYFDPVRSVEKAYQDGHSILMELINRGVLKIQENNVVVPEMAMSNLIDPRRRGLLGRSRLIFSRVYAGNKKEGLGKVAQIDDMIKTVQAKKGEKVSTLLVGGDRLRRETPGTYFKKLGDLKVLGLFEPTLDPLIPSLENLKNLRVLVIRDCDLLKNIEELRAFKGLHALEISGASSLTEITDDFFTEMPDLESLHLSGLQIKSSPSSISQLTKLHCLIIRKCPVLEDLPDIQKLKALEVVDISGAHGLETCFDKEKGAIKNKSKNKNFLNLKQLRLLDFSESQIERLPMFQDSAVPEKLHLLTRLLLRNCSKLRRLPSLKPLSGLQILDLSGTTSLVEMLEVCFEDKKELKILNLTGSNLGELATTIEELSNLTQLLLKNCTKLEALPNIEKLINLEVFDVSGCINLQTIEGSFKNMSYLREINLCGTKVKTTPELPKESKLHCPKRIVMADSSCFEREDWSQVMKAIENVMPESSSSSHAVANPEEMGGNESINLGEIQPSEPSATSDCIEKTVTERFHQVPKDKARYQKTLSFFDTESYTKVMEIDEIKGLVGFPDQDKEVLSTVEYVSFVDNSSTNLTSIFNEISSVKGCWLRMCEDITNLFSGVGEERLGSLEILSITNLRLLDSICSGGFNNLKKLSLDCCSNIKTLFLQASEMPNNLEVLHIKFCENLEKMFEEEVELSTLTTLCLYELPVLSAFGAKLPQLDIFDKRNCPKLLIEKKDLKVPGYIMVHHNEAVP